MSSNASFSLPELKKKTTQKNYAFMIYNQCKNLSKPLIPEIKRPTLYINAVLF